MALDLIPYDNYGGIPWVNLVAKGAKMFADSYAENNRREKKRARRKRMRIGEDSAEMLKAEKPKVSGVIRSVRTTDDAKTYYLNYKAKKNRGRPMSFQEYYKNIFPHVKQHIKAYGSWCTYSGSETLAFNGTLTSAIVTNPYAYDTNDFAPPGVGFSNVARSLRWPIGKQCCFEFCHLPINGTVTRTSAHTYISVMFASQYHPGLPANSNNLINTFQGTNSMNSYTALVRYQTDLLNTMAVGSPLGDMDNMNSGINFIAGGCKHTFLNPTNNEITFSCHEFTPRRYLISDTPIEDMFQDKIKRMRDTHDNSITLVPDGCKPDTIGFRYDKDDVLTNWAFIVGPIQTFTLAPGEQCVVNVEYPSFCYDETPWFRSVTRVQGTAALPNYSPQFTKFLVGYVQGGVGFSTYAGVGGHINASFSATAGQSTGVQFTDGQLIHYQEEYYRFQGIPQSQDTIEIKLNGMYDNNMTPLIVDEEGDTTKPFATYP